MKPCVYILYSIKDQKRNIGSTINLLRRMSEHKEGEVNATRHRRPLQLIAYRLCENIGEAAMWEKKYKRSHGQLDRDLKNGLLIQCIGD